MNPLPTIYTASTPLELRAAVVDLCWAAIDAYRCCAPEYISPQLAAESVVPAVPTTWRIVTVNGQSYRCADGVLEYLHGDGAWSKTTWVHPSHILLLADLIAKPTEASA